MAAQRRRKDPTYSFTKYLDVKARDPGGWTKDESALVERFEKLFADFRSRRKGMCHDGRVDAIYLEFESCRADSARLDPDQVPVFPLNQFVLVPLWLADCLRLVLSSEWRRGIPGERGRHSTTDKRLADAYIHFYRYSLVEDCYDKGMTLTKAIGEAPDMAPEGANFGAADNFRYSHRKVSGWFKTDPDRPLMAWYFTERLQANLFLEGET